MDPQAVEQRVIEQVSRHAVEEALAHLLTAWRAQPSVALADALDAVTAWITPRVAPIPATLGAWAARAADAQRVDQGRLAAGFFEPAGQLDARVGWLAAQPPDPRWGALWVQIFVRGWAARSRQDARRSRRAFTALVALGDPRTVLAIGAADLRARSYWRESARERVAHLSAACRSADHPPLTRLTAWLAAHPPPARATRDPDTGRRLRALIEAAPDADDAREIYADWLTRAGDPRGAFIRLQLARRARTLDWSEAEREADLLATHGLRWLGALAPCVRDVAWRGGFPHAADATIDDLRILEAGAWRTLKTLHLDDPRPLRHPHLAQVEQLGRRFALTDPRRPRPVPLAVVQAASTTVRRIVARPEALVDLTARAWDAVTLVYPHAGPAPSLAPPTRARLRALKTRRLTLWGVDPPAWCAALHEMPALERLTLVPATGALRLVIERGAQIRLTVLWTGALPCRDLRPAARVADRIGADAIVFESPAWRHSAEAVSALVQVFGDRPVSAPAGRGAG